MMVLSKNNVATNIGNARSAVIAKIHNMPWLKQPTAPKDSDRCEKADAKMNNATVEKKKGRRGSKNRNRKGTDAEVSKTADAADKTKNSVRRPNGRREDKYTPLTVTQGSFEKNAWSSDTNNAKLLFPNSDEGTRNMELSEDEQMKIALEASLETAMLEKCAIDSPEEDKEMTDERSDSEEENIWEGVHQNLPPAESEESMKSFDANNNAGASESQTSSIETKKIEDKFASRDESRAPKNEPASESEKIVVPPLVVPITPAIVPKFIDCYAGRDSYSERHGYMGKGGRKMGEQPRRNVQVQHRAPSGSQQKQYYGSGPQNSYPPRSAPPPTHDSRAVVKGSNDRRDRPPFPTHQDSQLPKNPQIPEDNSLNDDHARSKTWNDRNRHNLPSQDSHRPRYPNSADDNARNDRSQRRSAIHAPPNHIPHQAERYDPSKNPYKFQRDPSSRNTGTGNNAKGDSQKSNEVHRDDGDRSDTVSKRDNREPEIPTLMAKEIERPSNPVKTIQESAKPVERSEAKILDAAPLNNEPEIRQDTEEISENAKSHLRLSDFNSRLNTPHEQASLPIDPIPSRSSANSFADAPVPGYNPCQPNDMQINPAIFTVPPPGFEGVQNVRHTCGNAPYDEASLTVSQFAMNARNSVESPSPPSVNISETGNFIPIPKADLYARLKITDPMLYELLIQKEELDGVRNVSAVIPEIPKTIAIAQNSSQDSRSVNYDLPIVQQQQQQQQQRVQNELLNPNAKQFSPISETGWAALNQPEPMSCYSRVPNYDPPSMSYQHQYAGPPQDALRQDNSTWNQSGSNVYYNTEQSSQQHVHASVSEVTPTAILGRPNYLVSEKPYPYRNAPGAMNMPQLNDDYARCQTTGFENIPMVAQRQLPYRAPLPHCGTAPNHFCSIPCTASYGSQNQAATSNCAGCLHSHKPPQNYLDLFAMCGNSMSQGNVDPRRINDVQHRPIAAQNCQSYEINSIMQPECAYVVPTIRQGVQNDNKPKVGRGRARSLKDKK